MENGVEALKIAFGMLIFVLAITITISAFTTASQALHKIFDAQEEYYMGYVTSENGTREVGVETIIPTIYRAYKENFAIYFYDATSGETKPFVLYEYDNANGEKVPISCIDLEKEVYANSDEAIEHINEILYKENGLYEKFKQLEGEGKIFIEKLGEYYMDDLAGETNTADVNKIKKRVIAYTLYTKE